MTVKLVSDEKQFQDLKEAWKKLQSLGAVKDIITTWEWMSTWWSVFNEGKELAVLVVSDGEEVIGIAPFMRKKARYFRPIPIKNFPIRIIPYHRLEFIASGDEICSDYLNFIAKPGMEKEFLNAVFEFLCYSKVVIWEELVLYQMNTESNFVPLLFDSASKFGLNIEEIDRIPCLYVNLPDSFEDYLSSLGGKTRHHIRQSMKILNEEGKAIFKVAKAAEEVDIYKKILVQLHQFRWSQAGIQGRFSSDKYNLFHNKMIAAAHKENWLRLGVLFLNETPLACIYNFRFNDKIYSYQSGRIFSDNSYLSYGILVHANAIAHAISEKAKEYDFLAGVSEYKEHLAKERREIISLRISKPSSKESVYKAMCSLREWMVSIRNDYIRKRKNDK